MSAKAKTAGGLIDEGGWFRHETAVVDAGAEIGAGTRIWHFCHVSARSRLGEKCILGQNVFIAPGVALGNRVKVQNNVSVYEGVEVADDAFLGPSCVFTNVNTPRAHVERKGEFGATRVGRGATVGANATVVCGHDLGEYAFIGAGSVVTKNVPPHALMVGNPARRIGWMCACGERLLLSGGGATCVRCRSRYEESASGLRAL